MEPEYSMGFKHTWDWLLCWLFGHTEESSIVHLSDSYTTTTYWCTQCGDTYAITLGPIPSWFIEEVMR